MLKDMKIAMNLPLYRVPDAVRKVEEELGINIRIVHGVLHEAVDKIASLVDKGEVDAVISRGITYRMLRQVIDVPVISSHMTDIDVLKALWKAKRMGNRVAVLGYEHKEFSYEFNDLRDLLGRDISQYYFEDEKSFNRVLREAKKDGIDVVVVGATYAVEKAKKIGLNAVLVEISARSIAQAIFRVADALKLIKQDAEYLERFRIAFNSVSEGLLLTDPHGVITLCNEKFEALSGTDKHEIIGRKLEDLGINLRDSQTDQIVTCLGTKIKVYTEHIQVNSEKIGMVLTCSDVKRIQKIEHKIRTHEHKKGMVAKFTFDDLVAVSPAIKEVVDQSYKYGSVDSTVLIYGESGTGKELFAQSIHNIHHKRKAGPFVAINCSALPENLLESELFGYEEGAFTGAKKGGRAGIFEQAHNGTIFLDEIGNIPHYIQTRLLRVLQEREIMRIGGNRIIPINVRVIAATNVDLKEKVNKGEFRADLYYRLKVLTLHIPPLRDRREDIPDLVSHFLKKHEGLTGLSAKEIPQDLMHYFSQYHWPGNVRELENVVERWVVLTGGGYGVKETTEQIRASLDDGNTLEKGASKGALYVKPGSLREMNRQIIQSHLEQYRNRQLVAKKLGISRSTLWRMLNE